jgi:uroporphyrinogen-III synthase
MNIIDTSTNSKNSSLDNSIKNIPLFGIEPVEYKVLNTSITDIIFQSVASVKNFENFEICRRINVFAMGESTQRALDKIGINSSTPEIPGSSGLIELLGKKLIKRKFAIVKGLDGLEELHDHIIKYGADAENIVCYKRKKFLNYMEIREKFIEADVVIFSSTFAARIFFENIHIANNTTNFICISERIKEYINKLGYEAKTINYFSEDLFNEIRKTI